MVAAGLVLLAACGDDSVAPVTSDPPPIEALLGGTSMADTPWPSDVFLVDGRISVTSVPIPDGAPEPLAAMALALSEMDGAPVYGSVFFPVRGDLVDGPLEGKARWLDLDAPGREIETPLWVRASTSELVALAPTADVLAAGHRHAVIIESPMLGPSEEMRRALAGEGPFGALYTPLTGLTDPADVSAATVFTVGHPTAMVDRMREVAAARTPPTAVVTAVLQGEELEAFAGTPSTTRPGLGDPDGIVHDGIAAIVLGTFDAPSFLSATPPQLGLIELDGDGVPRVKGTEAIPFLLTIPEEPAGDPAAMPILIFQHGLNAGRAQVLSCASSYARAGYATIGVDAIWHADRAPTRRDEVHNFSGAEGPDGLADGDLFSPSVALFNFGGDEELGVVPFDGRYVRDNLRQAIVDGTELARFLRHGDLSPIADADPALAGIGFDGEHVVYTSESFGSVIGASVVAASPDLAGAVLSVGGGGVFLPIFPDSPTFAALLVPILQASFDPYLDVSDPARLPGAAQRSLSLLDAVISPGDPLSFAPLLAERKRNVLVLQARSDELIPNQATELLASAMGATSVSLPSRSEPLRFVTLPSAPAPFQAPESTLAVVQIAPALHTMFTTFDGLRRYEPDFPPFVGLASPERIDNPIELAHELAIRFAESLREGGPGRVEALP